MQDFDDTKWRIVGSWKSRYVAGLLLQAIPQNIFRVSKGTVRGMSYSFGECYQRGR